MTYIALILINTKEKLNWLVWTVVLSLGFYGAKGGLFTILTGGGFRVRGPAGSFIAGNNEMGLALIMVIPLMRYLQLQTKNFWIGHALTVLMLLSGIAAIGSQSRGALVGMVVMGAFLWLKSRKKIATLLPILAIVGTLYAILPQEWYDRMSTIEHYQHDESVQGRFLAWSTAFKLAKDRVTGGGFDTFKPGLYFRYGVLPKDLHTPDAHSIYFEVLGEHGFIGLGLFLLLAWFTWNTGSRIRRQARRNTEATWCADLASMTQVSIVGYASGGAFLGLAYFDAYYYLIAILVICSMLLKEQMLHAPAKAAPTVRAVKARPEQADGELHPPSEKY
jgi:probable O-glycosylation ligase (exosortase A-associated)